MAIDAKKKILNYIDEKLSNYEITREKDITELNELLDKTKVIEQIGGLSLDFIKDFYQLIDVDGHEVNYSNGLKYITSRTKYKDRMNKTHEINQYTLYDENNDFTIANLCIEKEAKSLPQFLVNSSIGEIAISGKSKNILVTNTSVKLFNNCGSIFYDYINLDTDELLLEKFMKFYAVTKYEPKSLLDLCGCGTRYLEIIYDKNKPIYAELSEKYKVESLGYDPNSPKDAQTIVDNINVEVDNIIGAIDTKIDELDKNNSHKKLIKK